MAGILLIIFIAYVYSTSKKIEKLEKEIKSLQKDMEQVDAILYEIDVRKEEEMLKNEHLKQIQNLKIL